MDVDGTLTNGKLYIGADGEEFKAFNIKDGAGIAEILPIFDITPIIITGRNSKIVERRCEELHISTYVQGSKNKLETLKMLVNDLSTVAYIGDDNNDLEIMKAIKNEGGLIGAPKDASKDVLEIVDYISNFRGGNGAVRDFIEFIIKKI